MKTRILILLFIAICTMLSECKSITSNTVPLEANNNPTNSVPVDFNEPPNTPEPQKNTQPDLVWEDAFNSETDMNGDDVHESINVYTLNRGDEITFSVKIKINNIEELYKFEPDKFHISSLRNCQFINLAENKKGLLIMLSSDSDHPDEKPSFPWWADRNFIVIGYDGDNITTLLDGLNTPYNTDKNYETHYLGDYRVNFRDIYANLSVDIDLINETADERYKDRISVTFNDPFDTNANVSMNYCNVEITNSYTENADSLVCSKHIPGFAHAIGLGEIDYIYEFQNGKYILAKEVLTYYEKSQHENAETIVIEKFTPQPLLSPTPTPEQTPIPYELLPADPDKPWVMVFYDHIQALNDKDSEAVRRTTFSEIDHWPYGTLDSFLDNDDFEKIEVMLVYDKSSIDIGDCIFVFKTTDPFHRTIEQDPYQVKQLYAEVDFKFKPLAENRRQGYILEGLNYFRVVTVQYTEESDWTVAWVTFGRSLKEMTELNQ